MKNPLASKNKVNTGLEAPWRHSYYAPPSQTSPPDSLESQESSEEESQESSEEEESRESSEQSEGSGSAETKGCWREIVSYCILKNITDESTETSKDESNESEEDSEDSDEYSLYSDIADQEYDYDEEDYEGLEDDDDVMPRNLPTDPIGKILHFTSFCLNSSNF